MWKYRRKRGRIDRVRCFVCNLHFQHIPQGYIICRQCYIKSLFNAFEPKGDKFRYVS
jgi:hypothetical protein